MGLNIDIHVLFFVFFFRIVYFESNANNVDIKISEYSLLQTTH